MPEVVNGGIAVGLGTGAGTEVEPIGVGDSKEVNDKNPITSNAMPPIPRE